MKRLDNIKNMTSEEFTNFLFDLDLCVVCRESNSKKDCIECHSIEEEKKVYKKWLDMEVQ